MDDFDFEQFELALAGLENSEDQGLAIESLYSLLIASKFVRGREAEDCLRILDEIPGLSEFSCEDQ